jgi:hypothetical protein
MILRSVPKPDEPMVAWTAPRAEPEPLPKYKSTLNFKSRLLGHFPQTGAVRCTNPSLQN